MKQLITRLDDELHARLKQRAAAEGRSVNDLVTRALANAVEQPMTRQAVRSRAEATGRLVVPEQPDTTPDAAAVREATRGCGQAASEALAAERAAG